MTFEEAVQAALARTTDEGNWNLAHSVPYERLATRQIELFMRANRIDAEYFSTQAVGTLVSGAVGIDTLVAVNLPPCDVVIRVTIENKGTSAYTNGDKVTLVQAREAASHYAPRAQFANRVIRGWGTDLALVTSIRLYYGRLPMPVAADEDGLTALELPDPFPSSLLVLDLARWIVQRSPVKNAEARANLLAAFDAEEKSALGIFDSFIDGANQALVSVGTRPGGAPVR